MAPDDLEELEDIFDDYDDTADMLSEEEVVAAFKSLDKNGDGLIALSDVRGMLIEAGAAFTEEDFNEVVGDLFATNNGQIDIKLFAEAFMAEDRSECDKVSTPPAHVEVECSKIADAGCFAGLQRAAYSLLFAN